MCDFSLGQINAVKYIFPQANIHCCFFHFSQAIWQHFKKNNLCGNNSYEKNNELLFNIQIMCFIKCDKIQNFFKSLKKKYKGDNYKKFFDYFNKTWLGSRYPVKLWNFNDIIIDEENNKNFMFTNNLCENINRFLNSNLKRGICSNFLFRASILSIIEQFENKTVNDLTEKKNQKF